MLAKVLVGKLAHFALFLALPLAVLPLPVWQVLVGYFTVHFFVGLTLAVVFQLAHNVEGIAFPSADARGSAAFPWADHQMHTTANFAVESKVALFLTGGLNHQVEHHLFSRICHVHYPALRPIVQRVAKAHGLPYLVEPSFKSALASHYRMLRRFGRPARQGIEQTWFSTPGVPVPPSP